MGWVAVFMILLTLVSAAAIISIALVRPKEHKCASKLSGFNLVECSYQTLSDPPTNRTHSTQANDMFKQDASVQGRLKTVSSRNWAGYVVASDLNNPIKKSVKMVSATWTIPRILPREPREVPRYSSTWVGIDGFNNSSTNPAILAQLGTESDWEPSQSGDDDGEGGQQVNYAWLKVGEKPPVMLVNFPTSAGDVISASIVNRGKVPGYFRMTIRNETRGTAVVIPSQLTVSPHSLCATAAFAIELPSNVSAHGTKNALADFGAQTFHECVCEIDQHVGPINDSSDERQFAPINMVANTDQPILRKIIAATSPLSPDGKSFSVTFNP